MWTWFVALRPFSFGASILPVVLGTVLARRAGYPPRILPGILTLAGVLGFHAAANLLNDFFDFRRGLDRHIRPHSGALVRGWLSQNRILAAALVSLAAGLCCGLVLTVLAGPVVPVLGLAGALLALGYTTPRFCFKYAGWGDAVIFLAFGPLTVFGSWWVQARTFSWSPIAWSLPPGLLAAGILHANNRRDRENDRGNGCFTPAVRLGLEAGLRYDRLLLLLPFLLAGIYVAAGTWMPQPPGAPVSVLLVFLALPAAVARARETSAAALPDLAAASARIHLLFTLLLIAAFL